MNENNSDFQKTLQEWAVLFARRSIHDFLKFARDEHISMPQINVLLRLYYSGPSSMVQLRGESGESRATASQMIDDLVRGGWLERREDEADRRVKVVSLTEAGRTLVERGIAARRKWLGELADSFPPEERAEIDHVLRRMIEAALALENKQS